MPKFIIGVKNIKVVMILTLNLIIGSIIVNSCVHAPYAMPDNQRTNDPNICFERDILPIFISNCTKSGCHNAQSHEGGYKLDNYENIMKKGIVPGNFAASKIWKSVTMNSGEGGKMPQNAPPLSATDLDLIKRWIVSGAVDSGACTTNCDTGNFTYSMAILPLMQTYCVGCHNSASAPGGSLMDYTSVMNAAVYGRMIGNIAHEPGYNPMPSVTLKLSDCQVTQVKKWVAAGALNN